MARLGELATPRWTRSVANRDDGLDQDDLEPVLPEEPEDVLSDSLWTIVAVDGEEEDEERDQVRFFLHSLLTFLITLSPVFRIQPLFKQMLRTIRTRLSVAEESGGEDILYPRTQFLKHSTSDHPMVYNPPLINAAPPRRLPPSLH